MTTLQKNIICCCSFRTRHNEECPSNIYDLVYVHFIEQFWAQYSCKCTNTHDLLSKFSKHFRDDPWICIAGGAPPASNPRTAFGHALGLMPRHIRSFPMSSKHQGPQSKRLDYSFCNSHGKYLPSVLTHSIRVVDECWGRLLAFTIHNFPLMCSDCCVLMFEIVNFGNSSLAVFFADFITSVLDLSHKSR